MKDICEKKMRISKKIMVLHYAETVIQIIIGCIMKDEMIYQPQTKTCSNFDEEKNNDHLPGEPGIFYKLYTGYKVTTGNKVYGKKKSSHRSLLDVGR